MCPKYTELMKSLLVPYQNPLKFGLSIKDMILPDPVDDMIVRLQLLAIHPEGIDHLILAIDVVVLDNRMHESVFVGNPDFAAFLFDLVEIVRSDLSVGDANRSATVHSLDMGAGHGKEDGVDLHIASVLGSDQRLLKATLYGFAIDNLSLANPGRGMLSHAENLQRAVASDFAYDETYFRGADLKARIDI